MTTVSPVQQGAVQNPATPAGAASLDYNAFLRLLVEQMKNQDPTEPMDSTEYVAQLATFSNVEQSIQTNSSLNELLKASYLSQAGSIVGRTVTSHDGSVSGTVAEVRVWWGPLSRCFRR
jgi:flagellar basal-body rod modification protein FlgD